MPQVVVDSRGPSPAPPGPLRSPPRPAPLGHGPVPSFAHWYSNASQHQHQQQPQQVPPPTYASRSAAMSPVEASAATAPSVEHRFPTTVNRSTQPSQRASPDRPRSPPPPAQHMWAPPYAPYNVPPLMPFYQPPPFYPVPSYAPQAFDAAAAYNNANSSASAHHRPVSPTRAGGVTSRPASPTKALPPAAVSIPAPPNLENIEAEYSARLEEKNREISTHVKANATLKAALKQTKESFEANTTQLRDCQELCRRLEETLADRDNHIRELEAYKRDTVERLENVDELVRREKEHVVHMAEDLRRQLDMVAAERTALEARLLASQEEVDKARHEIVTIKREHQREVHLAAQQARAQVELDAEEHRRAFRAKLDEKDGTSRHMENEFIALRGENQRERDRAEALRVKVEALQSEVITLQHKLQQTNNFLDEARQVRDADVASLRRENESLRAARDELLRANTGQVLQLTQETTKRGHDMELLQQQIHAQKLQLEAEQRRHRTELDDAVRAMETKLRGAMDDARQFERQLRAAEDAAERLRKQLGDERAGRDFTDGEKEALQDKIISLQRVIAKKDLEIQRCHTQMHEVAVLAEDKSKEAEAVACELAVREAREKRELSVALDTRLKEFRSVGRMRSQASYMGMNTSEAALLAERFGDVSLARAETLGLRDSRLHHQQQQQQQQQLYGDEDYMEPRAEQQLAAGVPTPGRPPRSSVSVHQSHNHGTPLRSPQPPQDIGVTPIVAAHDASNAAIHTMQRVLERQLAAERERNEALQRKLSEVSISNALSQQEMRSAVLEEGLDSTRYAAEAAVARGRRGAAPGSGGMNTSRRVNYADASFSTDVGTMAAPPPPNVPPLSPRAEQLRQLTDSLKRLPLNPRQGGSTGGSA